MFERFMRWLGYAPKHHFDEQEKVLCHIADERNLWQRLHRSLTDDYVRLSGDYSALLKYRHVQEIVANIESGKARKVKG